MQFESKPHEKDRIPVRLTTSELDWISQKSIPEGYRPIHHEMMCKLMQARRDAVGDKLPAELAELPLTTQDMPWSTSKAKLKQWLVAMGKLHAVEREGRSKDQPEPHTISVELTSEELDLWATCAGLELNREDYNTEAGYSEFDTALSASEKELIFDLSFTYGCTAAGVMDAIITYRQETLPH